MREFLHQCLEDLESITGLRQYYFLQIDPDFKRKAEVLLKGMELALNEYAYIPESAKKEIITEMMAKDQDYEALNSRTIHKWMGMKKDIYWERSNKSEHIDNEDLPPLKPETEKLIRDWQMSLLEKTIGNPVPSVTEEQLKAEARPQSLSSGYKPKPVDARMEKIRQYLTDKKGLNWYGQINFEMDGLTFRADSEEDGYTTFVEALK